MSQSSIPSDHSSKTQNWTTKAMRAEWIGQTLASICWISSVFVYGISSGGDLLQLLAASAWLFANIVHLKTTES